MASEVEIQKQRINTPIRDDFAGRVPARISGHLPRMRAQNNRPSPRPTLTWNRPEPLLSGHYGTHDPHGTNPTTREAPEEMRSDEQAESAAMRAVGHEGTERLSVARRRVSQAKAKAAAMVEIAEIKLRNLAGPAVATLERLLLAESENVALGAANSLVDRSVGKATERIRVAAAITVRRPW